MANSRQMAVVLGGRWLVALAFGLLPLAAQVPSATAAEQPRQGPGVAATAEVRGILAAYAERHRVPGLSCAVYVDGRAVVELGLGLADVENDVAATPTTVYRLASISKCLTALAAVQLAADGRLDLDADVHELLPAWPAKPWPVTTRQLLGHLGGVRHYRLGEAEVTDHYADQRAALVRFAADPLLHRPGSKYLYSTFGYNLVGAVVEEASGLRLAEYVRTRLAEPIGADSLQDDDVRRVVRGRARGYVRVGDELRNSRLMDSSYKLGGGGFCSSAVDLAKFGDAVLAGRVVSAEWLERMWSSGTLPDGSATGYGLGFGVGKLGGEGDAAEQRAVTHSGAQSQVSTYWVLLPESKVTVVLLCNLEGLKLEAVTKRVAQTVLRPGR